VRLLQRKSEMLAVGFAEKARWEVETRHLHQVQES
jgi:hypothetical protein